MVACLLYGLCLLLSCVFYLKYLHWHNKCYLKLKILTVNSLYWLWVSGGREVWSLEDPHLDWFTAGSVSIQSQGTRGLGGEDQEFQVCLTSECSFVTVICNSVFLCNAHNAHCDLSPALTGVAATPPQVILHIWSSFWTRWVQLLHL